MAMRLMSISRRTKEIEHDVGQRPVFEDERVKAACEQTRPRAVLSRSERLQLPANARFNINHAETHRALVASYALVGRHMSTLIASCGTIKHHRHLTVDLTQLGSQVFTLTLGQDIWYPAQPHVATVASIIVHQLTRDEPPTTLVALRPWTLIGMDSRVRSNVMADTTTSEQVIPLIPLEHLLRLILRQAEPTTNPYPATHRPHLINCRQLLQVGASPDIATRRLVAQVPGVGAHLPASTRIAWVNDFSDRFH